MRRLRLLPGDVELPVREGETILSAICRDGFTYRYGCRRGGCGICKLDLESGEIAYERAVAPTVLTDEERESGVVLTCRAVPVSPEVVLRMRESNRFRLAVPLAFGIARDTLRKQAPGGSPGPVIEE
ncbi:2Fe-2S iron-sulfur cluster-binding protein [Pseudonocardia sp. WMMC193]|uniref:2Fe-2S iron-sulfur cluster-binding protein n=1 Tax=Pseudonocardia sp. WMMC193 TaxID=2911965 RepID=UPI001F032C3F|nr:2Fe-2S iron-sulfur cluster-binding protein [Pseudonocardia sp. WMMC193]MCF7550857.1 2Fe-2S iron-sulfur cluster-binding protein [Pseudonocardia sp. WMMC193]